MVKSTLWMLLWLGGRRTHARAVTLRIEGVLRCSSTLEIDVVKRCWATLNLWFFFISFHVCIWNIFAGPAFNMVAEQSLMQKLTNERDMGPWDKHMDENTSASLSIYFLSHSTLSKLHAYLALKNCAFTLLIKTSHSTNSRRLAQGRDSVTHTHTFNSTASNSQTLKDRIRGDIVLSSQTLLRVNVIALHRNHIKWRRRGRHFHQTQPQTSDVYSSSSSSFRLHREYWLDRVPHLTC